jgi:hemoglobin-like flavoprotein
VHHVANKALRAEVEEIRRGNTNMFIQLEQQSAVNHALLSRIDDVEGMEKMIHADSAAHHLMLHDITRITRAVSAWLKEGR